VHASDHWFRTAGGGEGARLASCLAACMDSAAGDVLAPVRLAAVLQDAREHQDREIQVLALDALARSCARAGDLEAGREHLALADGLLPAVQHLLDEADRLDAARARGVLA
jgi:hypothetical protein